MLATSPPFDVFYRRPGQAMNLASHDQLFSDNFGGSAYPTKRDTPELETKPGGPPRKRVPVACERCRKRKIKCSGDQGDGSGCDSCKSAGWDGCQFLRVRSSVLDVTHPGISSNRGWHQQQHYHPYSAHSRTRHMPYLQTQHHAYSQPQSTAPYTTWPSSLDYAGITAPASTPWSHGNYSSTYPMYETESTSPYAAQPPSYMLPDPDHGMRHNVSYMSSMSRPQQNSLWLEQMNSASVPQQVSSIYPLTPAESTKSYAMLGAQPAHHTLSNERTLPQPILSGVASLPSNGHETPPLSAVSHRSSHTWNTDSASHISNASSRTSCGGSQDLSGAAHSLTTCEDQAAIYPYPADSTSPVVDSPAAALLVATDHNQQEQSQQLAPTASDSGAFTLHSRNSRDSFRTSPPANSLYGYSDTTSRHRGHGMLTTRLLTSGFTNNRNASPAPSRNSSLGSQQATNEVDPFNQFSSQRASASSISGAQPY